MKLTFTHIGSKMTLAWAATGGELDMTRTTNARIAGFTYLFYAVIGACLELLMHQARGVGDDAAKLVRIGQYATNVRLAVLIRSESRTTWDCFGWRRRGARRVPRTSLQRTR